MKKAVLFAAIALAGIFAQAQTVTGPGSMVVQMPSEVSNEYFINGISTREDIGGVEMSRGYSNGDYCAVEFVNYNSFPVNVIFELENPEGKKLTGSIVLKAGERKSSGNTYLGEYHGRYRSIVRKFDGKLAEPSSQENQGWANETTSQTSNAPINLYGYLTVFPNDLGKFSSEPTTIINAINAQEQYGYDSWRLPTQEELELMRSQGLVGSDYMTTSNKNSSWSLGVRLVTTDKTIAENKAEIANLFVDLGLSVKWAKCNMDASSPEKSGSYYTWSNAAKINGEKGRTPTSEEQHELISKCTWKKTTMNGVNGYKVTGPNGNSIFLPAAGYRSGGTDSLINVGSSGYYWSSTGDHSFAEYMYNFRCFGYGPTSNKYFSVRTVRDK